jgi:hypothetical protein
MRKAAMLESQMIEVDGCGDVTAGRAWAQACLFIWLAGKRFESPACVAAAHWDWVE